MISILANFFVHERDNYTAPSARRSYGMLCSVVGILLNILLFSAKYFAGILSGSIAITADAFNNLSDAGSSLITLLGFKFAGMKPDREHPFGHGRIEYIAGFVVSMATLLMAYELGTSSIAKIFSPTEIEVSAVALGILALSVAVKVYMYIYNMRIGEKIGSEAMLATAADSISDAIATTAVMVAMVICHYTGYNIDAYCGIMVALFILRAGYTSARDTLSPLLGRAPDPEFVAQVRDIVLSHSAISGIHDLVVHDYGPARLMATLHAEVDEDSDILEIHEQIDHIENEVFELLGCEIVMHMDPISTKNVKVIKTREDIASLLLEVDPDMTIHDFRMVIGNNNTNVIFDAVLPVAAKLSEAEARQQIFDIISLHYPKYTAVIRIDKEYTQH